jgi:hypothetical protein
MTCGPGEPLEETANAVNYVMIFRIRVVFGIGLVSLLLAAISHGENGPNARAAARSVHVDGSHAGSAKGRPLLRFERVTDS